MAERILVIRLSSLGDIVMSLPAFATIRRNHPDDTITLMTTAPYAAFMAASPYFDDVIIDTRPKWKNPGGWLRLRQTLRAQRFDRVYDLQNADRTGLYMRLMTRSDGGPLRSGTSKYATHQWTHPDRFSLTIAERHNAQLALAGVNVPAKAPLPDLSWVNDIDPGTPWAGADLPPDFALLIPGASAHRGVKRWPPEHFGWIASQLVSNGMAPVVLGTALEAESVAAIRALCPTAIDLTGKTDFFDLVRLGRKARVAIGGDTGPMHLIAAAAAPSVALISGQTNPSCMPRGASVLLERQDDLRNLDPPVVWSAVVAQIGK